MTLYSVFGDFAIAADTILPKITGVNIYPGKEIKKQQTIKCLIEDKESGIKKIRDQRVVDVVTFSFPILFNFKVKMPPIE